MSQINKVLLTTLRKLVSLPDVKQKLRRVLSAASECLSKVVPKAKFPADRIVCGGGGVFLGIRCGGVPYSRPKTCHFLHPFSDLA